MGKNPVTRMHQLVTFSLDGQCYALYLYAVERIVRAVEVTRLPKAPPIVDGVINVRGRIIPVVNIRRRFGLPMQDINLTDRLIIARTARRGVALWVDSVNGVVECPGEAVIEAGQVLPGMEYVEGVVKLADGMILIHDLDRFLSLDEENALDQAMRERQHIQEGAPG